MKTECFGWNVSVHFLKYYNNVFSFKSTNEHLQLCVCLPTSHSQRSLWFSQRVKYYTQHPLPPILPHTQISWPTPKNKKWNQCPQLYMQVCVHHILEFFTILFSHLRGNTMDNIRGENKANVEEPYKSNRYPNLRDFISWTNKWLELSSFLTYTKLQMLDGC